MAEWGERQPDGSVIVYDNSSGVPVPVRREDWATNQGQPPPGTMGWVGGEGQFTPPVGAGQQGDFDTSKGPDGQPLQPGQRWVRTPSGGWAFQDANAPGQTPWTNPQTGAAMSAPPGGGGGIDALGTAVARGFTFDQDTARMQIQAQIDQALRNYALAQTAEQRNQAMLDLQRWQAELNKVQTQQQTYADMAQAILGASVQLQNRPADYFKFNQFTSGGRDIFRQMGEGRPGFSAPTGPIEPGSIDDLMRRLGIGPFPATPATPAGVLPGAPNPPLGGGAAAPGAAPGGGSFQGKTLAQLLAELDVAAGGTWGGNRADPQAVAAAWWGADPSRRAQPVPAWG